MSQVQVRHFNGSASTDDQVIAKPRALRARINVGRQAVTPIDQILKRIDDVLRDNRRTETLYIVMSVLLFGAGIGCLIQAVYLHEFMWSIPPVATTALLHYPMKEIRDLRAKNIALATAPLLISTLPVDKAAEEMIRLLKSLHGEASA